MAKDEHMAICHHLRYILEGNDEPFRELGHSGGVDIEHFIHLLDEFFLQGHSSVSRLPNSAHEVVAGNLVGKLSLLPLLRSILLEDTLALVRLSGSRRLFKTCSQLGHI